jgi:gamma-glutamylcysteine synthetase
MPPARCKVTQTRQLRGLSVFTEQFMQIHHFKKFAAFTQHVAQMHHFPRHAAYTQQVVQVRYFPELAVYTQQFEEIHDLPEFWQVVQIHQLRELAVYTQQVEFLFLRKTSARSALGRDDNCGETGEWWICEKGQGEKKLWGARRGDLAKVVNSCV